MESGTISPYTRITQFVQGRPQGGKPQSVPVLSLCSIEVLSAVVALCVVRTVLVRVREGRTSAYSQFQQTEQRLGHGTGPSEQAEQHQPEAHKTARLQEPMAARGLSTDTSGASTDHDLAPGVADTHTNEVDSFLLWFCEYSTPITVLGGMTICSAYASPTPSHSLTGSSSPHASPR